MGLFAALTAFAISALTAPLIIAWYSRKGWVDDPKTHTHAKVTHQNAVPRGGGLVVLLGILTASIFWLQWDSYLWAIMAGAVLLALVGWWDDVKDISPRVRLVANVIAALIVIGSGIGIAYISHPFQPGVIHLDWPRLEFTLFGEWRSVWMLSDLLALLFIVWNMNIVNWSKGVDGQLPAFVAVSFLVMSIVAGKFLADPTTFGTYVLTLICAGAFAGLLVWNWYPQKMMPGYGAGSLAGYFLAILAILSGAKVAAVVMTLAIPTADAIFTIARRLDRGKSPFLGDRGHLHHKLLDVYSWNIPSIAIFYSASSLFFGLLALYLNTMGKLLSVMFAGILVIALQVEAKRRSGQASKT